MQLSIRQKKAVRKLYRREGGAAWWRVGTGKTRIAYAFFAMIAKEIERGCHFLIVCRRQAFSDWQEEMEKLGLKWKWNEIESENDLFGFLSSKSRTTVHVMSHGKLARMKDVIVDYATYFDGVAYDEGFLYKNPKTHHCKAANKLSTVIGRAIILSGSIMTARNLEDVYGQLYAINKHNVLARTLTEFRSQYMFKLQIGNTGYGRFVNAAGATKEIAGRIRPVSSVYFPPNNQREIVNAVKTVEPTPAQKRTIQRLREEYYLEYKGKQLEIRNAPSLITKAQQISDGWVKMEDGDIVPVPSGKLEKLLSICDELLDGGEKVVVWCAFIETATRILQSLQKHFGKASVFAMSGQHKFDRAGWRKSGRIAVCTVGSGSSVNHFKDCAYAIYYSHDFRWLNLQQSRGRTNRHDSKHRTCYYIFLQTKDTLDQLVYKTVHTSGKKEAELLALAGVKQWLKHPPQSPSVRSANSKRTSRSSTIGASRTVHRSTR